MSERQRAWPERPGAKHQEREAPSERQRAWPERPGAKHQEREAPSGLPDTTSRRGLVVGLVLGLPVVAYGVRGALVDAADTHPAELAAWILGSGLAGDLVLVPLALGAGSAARRLTPRTAWPAVRAGLIVTGTLCLVAWPFVRGYGRDPTIPSLLDRNYGAGLAAALAAVWGAVALWLAGAAIARHRRPGR